MGFITIKPPYGGACSSFSKHPSSMPEIWLRMVWEEGATVEQIDKAATKFGPGDPVKNRWKTYTRWNKLSRHLKIGRAPQGKDHLPTIHFQVAKMLSFREDIIYVTKLWSEMLWHYQQNTFQILVYCIHFKAFCFGFQVYPCLAKTDCVDCPKTRSRNVIVDAGSTRYGK